MQLVAGDMKAMLVARRGATLDIAAHSGSLDAVPFLLEKGHDDVEERVDRKL